MKTATKAPRKPETFYPGLAVHWFPHEGSEPYPAFLTAVGVSGEEGREEYVVELAVLAPGYQSFMVRDGVRHKDDPRCRRNLELNPDVGFWDYTPESRLLRELQRRVLELEGLAAAAGPRKK